MWFPPTVPRHQHHVHPRSPRNLGVKKLHRWMWFPPTVPRHQHHVHPRSPRNLGVKKTAPMDVISTHRAETSAPRPPPKSQELGSKKNYTANKTVQAWNPRAARNRAVLNKARRFQRPTPIYITFIYILDLDLFLKDWMFNVFCLVILYFSKLDFQSSNYSNYSNYSYHQIIQIII